MRALLAFVLLVALAAPVAAQEVLIVHYEAEGIETGSHIFGPGGLYRWDRTSHEGESLSMIVNGPERIEINHSLGVAVRGAVEDTSFEVPAHGQTFPLLEDVHPDSPEYEGLVAAIESGAALEVEGLGARARERLLLRGYRTTEETSTGMSIREWWEYTSPAGRTVELEYSYSDGGSQQITGIERISVAGMFSMPSGLDVVDRWQR